MEFLGLILTLVGLAIMAFARRTEGLSGAVLFMLGVALAGMGIYLIFFETGEGLNRWLG